MITMIILPVPYRLISIDSMNYNPREITMETLYHVLSNVLERDTAVTDEIVLTLKQDMIQWGILSDDNLLIVDETKYKSLMKNLLENNAVLNAICKRYTCGI